MFIQQEVRFSKIISSINVDLSLKKYAIENFNRTLLRKVVVKSHENISGHLWRGTTLFSSLNI